MNALRILLIMMILAILGYTAVVGVNHGWNLIPVFFSEMLAMTWSGQFNLDFMCFLLLSGLWTAWRNNFTPHGLLLGSIAFFLGTMFLAPYLLLLSYRAKGDIKCVLAGSR
jgi:hypothetical protein